MSRAVRVSLLFGVLLLAAGLGAEDVVPEALPAAAEDPADAHYRVRTVRAAPGQLAPVIEGYRDLYGGTPPDGPTRPWIIRHSQGDHWDLMLVFPLESFAAHFRALDRAGADWAARRATIESRLAFSEDLLMVGPDHDVTRAQFAANGYAHIEVFHALAGHGEELLQQRRMENDYLRRTGQTANLIFVTRLGGDADVMTLGLHKSLAAFAAPPAMPDDQRDQVARDVGFGGLDGIGLYLRSLLMRHQDTLGPVLSLPEHQAGTSGPD